MIRPYMSLLIYSGMKNPETILGSELEQKVLELVKQLDKPFDPPKPYISSLEGSLHMCCNHHGNDCYFIYWTDYDISAEEALTTVFPLDVMGIHVYPGGCIDVYRKEENFGGKLFQDTVGLWKLLNPEGDKLTARHLRDSSELMETAYENLQGIPFQAKILY